MDLADTVAEVGTNSCKSSLIFKLSLDYLKINIQYVCQIGCSYC